VSWPWRSPEATRRALSDRVKARYPAGERQRRLREIAYRRLLFRLFEAQPERWVVKGGAALLLRLDPNRTSNDIDLAYVHEAGEHAVALRALREAVLHDAADFFEFDIASGHLVDGDHPLERAYSVPVVARVGDKEFASFSIDLALPRERVEAEWIEAQTEVTGETAVDGIPRIATSTFPAQLADKVCALFEKYGELRAHSSRARDLADIAMIASQVDLDGGELVERVRAEERRRIDAKTLDAPLPEALTLPKEQRQDWARRWRKATRGAPIAFDEALALASALVDPILSGSADGASWNAERQRWHS
jgi:predicted nucleotidyltransferase component of viral defense system